MELSNLIPNNNKHNLISNNKHFTTPPLTTVSTLQPHPQQQQQAQPHLKPYLKPYLKPHFQPHLQPRP